MYTRLLVNEMRNSDFMLPGYRQKVSNILSHFKQSIGLSPSRKSKLTSMSSNSQSQSRSRFTPQYSSSRPLEPWKTSGKEDKDDIHSEILENGFFEHSRDCGLRTSVGKIDRRVLVRDILICTLRLRKSSSPPSLLPLVSTLVSHWERRSSTYSQQYLNSWWRPHSRRRHDGENKSLYMYS
jgi:hypothetical protein